MCKYYSLYVLAIINSSVAQILIKAGANRTKNKKLIFTLINVFTISGYGLFFIATLLSVYALRVMPLKMGVMLLPLGYILVGVLSRLIFKERISRRQMVGAVMIITGALVYNL